MRIQSASTITHPIDVVYDTYRNKLSETAAYMPDIREIVCESREEREGGATIHNVWISSAEMPRGINKIVRPEHLRWDDYAEWNDVERTVDWRIQVRVFAEAVTCGGTNRFIAKGDGATELVLDGDLQIDLDKVRGIPSMLGRRIKPRIESFIIGLVTPNLVKVNACLQQYLDENAS